MPYKRYSDEYKRNAINEIEQRMREGMTNKEAANKAGCTPWTYTLWKRKLERSPRTLPLTEGPTYAIRKGSDWETIIAEYNERAGTIKQRDFCKERGVSYTAFLSALWISRHGKRSKMKNDIRTVVPIQAVNGHSDEMKVLKAENMKLRLIISDYALDIQALKDYAGRR